MSLLGSDLWGAVVKAFGSVFLEAAAVGGSTTTIIDTSNLAAVYADDYWINAWVYVLTDAGALHAAPEGEIRRVSDFASSTGTITVPTAFTAAVVATDTYRLWTGLPKADFVDCAKLALRASWPAFYADVIDETLTIATDTYEYDIPAAIQVLREVYIQGDSDATHYDKLSDWHPNKSGSSTRHLVLDSRHDYILARKLRLVGMGPLAYPATDATALTVAPEYEEALLEYVGFKGAAEAHRRALGRDSSDRPYHVSAVKMCEDLAHTARGKRMPRGNVRAQANYPWYW